MPGEPQAVASRCCPTCGRGWRRPRAVPRRCPDRVRPVVYALAMALADEERAARSQRRLAWGTELHEAENTVESLRRTAAHEVWSDLDPAARHEIKRDVRRSLPPAFEERLRTGADDEASAIFLRLLLAAALEVASEQGRSRRGGAA